VHAVSVRLSNILGVGPAGRTIDEIPANLFMEMVRNGLFNHLDNDYCVIDRALCIWQDIAPDFERVKLRRPPHELHKEALGMGFEDFFSLGGLLWWHAKLRDPFAQTGPRMTTPAGLPGVRMEQDLVDTFLRHVSAPPEWFVSEFKGSTSE
jgi:hypothetical protein